MTPEELFTAALGLGRQWRVAECRFEGEPKRLEWRLEHVPGEHFKCPVCQASCGIHDTIERRSRHMNFFQYRCELVAKVSRTWCRTERSPSDTGALDPARQWFHPDDGSARDAAQRADAGRTCQRPTFEATSKRPVHSRGENTDALRVPLSIFTSRDADLR
jgi:hypothetical protein